MSRQRGARCYRQSEQSRRAHHRSHHARARRRTIEGTCGLAGLRLGFVIGASETIARIATALGPWPCSGPALLIGAAALGDQQWAERTRRALQQQAQALDEVLVKAGFQIAGGTSLFRLA